MHTSGSNGLRYRAPYSANKYFMTAVVSEILIQIKEKFVLKERVTWKRLMLRLYLRKAPEKMRERRSMPSRVMKV